MDRGNFQISPVKTDEECQILHYQPCKSLRPTRASTVKRLHSQSTQDNTFNHLLLSYPKCSSLAIDFRAE
jgi:hypothetical protein